MHNENFRPEKCELPWAILMAPSRKLFANWIINVLPCEPCMSKVWNTEDYIMHTCIEIVQKEEQQNIDRSCLGSERAQMVTWWLLMFDWMISGSFTLYTVLWLWSAWHMQANGHLVDSWTSWHCAGYSLFATTRLHLAKSCSALSNM